MRAAVDSGAQVQATGGNMNDAKPWTTSEWADCEDPADAVTPDGNYMNPVHVARTLATCRQRDELVEVLTEIARLKRGGIEATDSEEEWTAFWAERCGKYETAARAVLAKWGTP